MKKLLLILAMITLFGCSPEDKPDPVQEQKTCYVCSLINKETGRGFTTPKECRTDKEQQEFLARVKREGYSVVKCDKV